MKSQKNLSESKVELLPERINDTSKLAEVIPDNILILTIKMLILILLKKTYHSKNNGMITKKKLVKRILL